MTDFLVAVAVVLLLTIVAGMLRILRGPTQGDRMLAAQLFGTTGVAVVVLLAFAAGMPRWIDVGLVLALLAAVVGVAFARRGWTDGPDEPRDANEVRMDAPGPGGGEGT